MSIAEPTSLIGVHPRREFEDRSRLWAALSAALPVRFEARDEGAWRDLDALVEIGGAKEARAAAAAGMRALSAAAPEGRPSPPVHVVLADEAALDGRLRGRRLPETRLGDSSLPALEEASTRMAGVGREALWTRAGRLDLVATAPLELAPGEALRGRLGHERFAALLPLFHLLRELTAELRWRPPELRAAFMLDDPNLHWPSYGFLKLPELARHSATHGYHLALAMVPLDACFVHRGAARVMRESRNLSLVVHGNDHFGGELGSATDEREALALAAQSLRRITRLERRSGLSFSRVMVPPHEECSEAVAHALARTGFDAITMTRPYPWLSAPPRHWLSAPEGAPALAGWLPADLSAGNLPVLLRHPLAERRPAELALRAYLDQPLILYGHHGDLAAGLEGLADAAAAVNELGAVQWGSIGEIAASNVETRREGSLLRARLFSRRVRIAIPEGVESLSVDLPPQTAGGPAELVVAEAEGRLVEPGEPFPVTGPAEVEVVLRRADFVRAEEVAPPPRRRLATVRRMAGEGRDRAQPVLRRLAG